MILVSLFSIYNSKKSSVKDILIQKDCIFEEGFHIEVNKKTIIPKELSTCKFKVDYTFQDGQFRAKDSIMFKTVPLSM